MNNEWIELNDMQAVALAKAEGWEIQCSCSEESVWNAWFGNIWFSEYKYRGRPPQPKKRIVKSLCWRNKKDGGSLVWCDETSGYVNDVWQRFPAGGIEGEVAA